ncbi:MAG: hypothetical protein F082_67 [bacterium F082]|nr:MAG: hypothetical protein F082_67 [bacterium F082]KWW31816.1 MAG: hypothetical protein AUK64_65 [bacterium P201]
MKKGLSILINILLFAVIVFLAWQVVKSIQAPIKFNNEQKARETKVVERLIDIRNAEVLYKNVNNKYTADFDSLIQFCQTAEIPIVKIVPDPTDTTFTRTINDTLGFVKVMDSIKSTRENFNINDLKYVPFAENQQQFELEAGMIKRNGIDIPVFEARTPYEVYLATPGANFNEKEWNQRRDNAKAEKESINRYAGLRVGSMEEATTDGNWEKL